MKSPIRSIAALIAATTLVTGVATAAQADAAPELPSGTHLMTVDCDSHGGQLWDTATSGSSTPIGAPGTEAVECAGGASTDPTTGITYFVSYGDGNHISTINPLTGEVTVGPAISGATTSLWNLMITNSGVAYGTYYGIQLYTVNLSTGVTTSVGDLYYATDDFNVCDGAAGYNPLTDTMYVYCLSTMWTVDRNTGNVTPLVELTWPDFTCITAPEDGEDLEADPDSTFVFDSNGIAWIQSDSCDFGSSGILAWNPVGNETWTYGQIFDASGELYPNDDHSFYTETFFLYAPTPEPTPTVDAALASTGSDASSISLVAAGFGLLGMMAISTIALRRRHSAR